MKNCPNGHENPDNAQFCRKCGYKFEEGSLPFYLAHPELHLRPISEFEDLVFVFNKPEYVEDPSKAIDSEYLYIAKGGKLGILYWRVEHKWWGTNNDFRKIIPCKYDSIDKEEGYFVCHSGAEIVYFDLQGNILR